jgi:hypothetical protein
MAALIKLPQGDCDRDLFYYKRWLKSQILPMLPRIRSRVPAEQGERGLQGIANASPALEAADFSLLRGLDMTPTPNTFNRFVLDVFVAYWPKPSNADLTKFLRE